MFNPANEDVGIDEDICAFTILKRMYRVFGPFPQTYQDFAERNPNLSAVINIIHEYGPPEKSFHRISPIEVSLADKKFILNIMKLDQRDRPTAQQLLDDEWFTEESEDTRIPLEEYYGVIRQRNAPAKAAKEASEVSKSEGDEESNTSRDPSENMASQGIQ